MSYLAPSFHPFLFLALIPIILYLLFRRKRNDVDWGATYILKKTLQSKSRQNIWKQMFILALRTLFLIILILGFARPILPRGPGDRQAGFPHGPGTLHRVILLDNSRSMAALHGSMTREGAAKAVLREAMLGMRAGDTFHIIPLCPSDRDEEELAALGLACPIREEVALETLVRVPLTRAAADLERGLRKAKEVFAGSPSANKQLILLSDLTRKDHPSIAGYATFGEALEEMNVRTASLFLGEQSAGNLALGSLTFGTDMLLKGQPTQLYVTVINYSEKPSSEGFLSVLVDGKVFTETSCVLSPGQKKVFGFPFVPSKSTHHIEARLNEDTYGLDNQIERSVDVKERLGLLLLHRDEKDLENVFERDSEFARRVLGMPEEVLGAAAPSGAENVDSGGDWIRKRVGLAPRAQVQAETDLKYEIGYTFDVVSRISDQVTSREIGAADVVLCSEVSRLSAPLLKALLTFVRRGGGLALGVGPGIDASQFNETFGELLPYPLAQPFRNVAQKLDYDRYLNVQPSDISLAILKEFEKATNGNLADGRFYNHYRLQLPEEPASERVLLGLSNGDPVLLHRRYGKGSVLLWASTLGGTWNSLVVHQAYVPLLVRLLNYSASFALLSRNLEAGSPIIHDVTRTAGRLFLTTPDNRLVELSRIHQGEKQFIRFEEARLAGTYELQQEGGQTLARFFVHLSDEESDLRPITSRMEGELIDGLHVRVAGAAERALPTTVEELKTALYEEGEGDEITTWVFLVVMLLLLTDAALVKFWFS